MANNKKLFFYVNDSNIDKTEAINLLKNKSLENATFCGNAYKIIKTGIDISINLPTKSKAIDNSNSSWLIYIDDHDKSKQVEILNNNSIEEIFCKLIFKIIKKGYDNDNFDIPIINFNYISNYIPLPIVTFTYDTTNEMLNLATEYVLSIINSIIIQSNKSESYNVSLSTEYFNDPDILGYAIWETQTIVLNSNNNDTAHLNDIEYNMNYLVLLHELFHILGLVGVGSPGYVYIDTLNNTYTGENGVKQYKNLLLSNLSIITNLSHNVSESEINNIQVIPIEDDFGSGTAHSHFEEGYDETNGVISHEPRYINGIFHPTLMNEIMSGFLDHENYLTPLTLGVLEDIGYIVNYNSEHVLSTGDHMYFK